MSIKLAEELKEFAESKAGKALFSDPEFRERMKNYSKKRKIEKQGMIKEVEERFQDDPKTRKLLLEVLNLPEVIPHML